MKICPKCKSEHDKPGIFCTRHCANSRKFSEETNKRRSIANKIAYEKYWQNDPRALEIKKKRELNRKKCCMCNTPIFNGRKTCSVDCYKKLRASCKKNKGDKVKIQKLSLTSISQINLDYVKPLFGVPGMANSLEKEILRRKRIKEKAILHNGGYRLGSGRGKKGWYKGIYCESSWELAFILFCERYKIDVRRNKEKFDYEFNGKVRKYLPDFIVNEQYVEIKGYLTDQNKAKLAQFPYKIKVYLEAEMKPIIAEVVSWYGKNYISLYEKLENAEVGSSNGLENRSST